MRTARRYMKNALSIMPYRLIRKFVDAGPIIPYYHIVSDERVMHVSQLYPYKNVTQFTADVEFLAARFEAIGLADLIDNVKYGRTIKKNNFLLTFDDGYSQMYSIVAPILFKRGIPAIFFLATDFIDNSALSYDNKASIIIDFMLEHTSLFQKRIQMLPRFKDIPIDEVRHRILAIDTKKREFLDEIAEVCGLQLDEYLKRNEPYLSSDQIKRMIAMGFSFGAHSMGHPFYPSISLDEQIDQTIGSVNYIRRQFQVSYSVFAFPYTDADTNTEFFRRIENQVELTFGTRDVLSDSLRSSIQRINFERSLDSAKTILARHFLRKAFYKYIRMGTIRRA